MNPILIFVFLINFTGALSAQPRSSATARPAGQDPLALYRSITARSPKNIPSFSSVQRQTLWRKVFAHRIVGLDDPLKLKKYDPTGVVGHCFTRAEAEHLEALEMGLKPENAYKLIVIGDLRSGSEPEWRFHETFLDRDSRGKFYAEDPIMPGSMTAEAWIARVQEVWDKGRKAKFYLTSPSVVIPDLSFVPEIAKETGERVIETSFDPSRHAGFLPVPKLLGPSVYQVQAGAAAKHFRMIDHPQSPFDFLGITINGQWVSYNDIFPDLLREILYPSSQTPKDLRLAAASSAPSRSPLRTRPLGFHLGR